MSGSSADNKRIARNTIFLYIRMFIVLIISLYVTRAVLNSLGVVDFGIYNVVAGFVSLFSFFEATISGCVQRYYNYYGTKEGESGFNIVYSASIIVSLAFALLLLVIFETGGVLYLNKIMVIPEDRLPAANIVFQFIVASFFLLFVQLPFVSMIIAKERMDFYAIVNIVEAVLKLGMAIVLPYISSDHLVFYGLSMFLISLAVCILMIVYAKHNFKFLEFSMPSDSGLLKSFLGFSGWSFVGTFAFMLKGQGLNVLLNYFFGPVINAARGVAFQVNNAVGGFSSNISMAFRPQIVNTYADDDRERSFSLMFRESKICFSLIAVLLIPIALEIDYLLYLWLGDSVPEHAQLFTVLVLVDSLICTLNTPCTQIVYANGNIRSYQIFSTIVNLFLLPVCLFFLWTGYPAVVVFILTIIFSLVNQAVCTAVAGKVAGFKILDYIFSVLVRCLPIALVAVLPFALTQFMKESIIRLLVVVAASVLSAVPVVYFLVLNKPERCFVKGIVLKYLRKNDEKR